MPKEIDSVKYKVWRVVVAPPFEYFIMTLIVLNTILLMMKVSRSNKKLCSTPEIILGLMARGNLMSCCY